MAERPLSTLADEASRARIAHEASVWLLAACLGAAGAIASWSSDPSWRFDAGTIVASAILLRGRGAIAATVAAVGASLLLGIRAVDVLAAELGPALFAGLIAVDVGGLRGLRSRDLLFLERLALGSVLAALPAAWLPALAGTVVASSIACAVLGTIVGIAVVTPLLIRVDEVFAAPKSTAIAALGSAAIAALLAWPGHVISNEVVLIPIAIAAAVAVIALVRGNGLLALTALLCVALLTALGAFAWPVVALGSVATGAVALLGADALRSRTARERDLDRSDALLGALPIGVFRTSDDGVVVSRNSAFGALLESTSAFAWRDAASAADQGKIAAAWQRLRTTGEPLDEVYRVDGESERWVRVRLTPEHVDGTVGFIGIVTDVSRLRAADSARESTEAHARAILDSAVDAIIVINESGIVASFNRSAQRIFGYRSEEVVGRNVAMLMPREHAEHHDQYLSRYLETGIARIIGIGRELEGRRSDGTLFPMALAVSELTVGGNRTFTGIIRDISKERAAAEEIRRRNEELSVTVDNAPMGIATYRFGERLASANRAFCTLTARSGAELAGLAFADLVVDEDRTEFDRQLESARRGDISRFSMRLRLRRADGTEITVATHNAVTHDATGKPALVIVHAEDLTATLHAAEAERAHRDELARVGRLSTLGEMTAGIAHEINQPLTAIALYAQAVGRMLDAGNPNPARLREAAVKLAAQSLRAGAVIDRIQRLFRHRESVRESVAVNALVTDTMRLAETDARVNGMQIELDLAPELPNVRADLIELQQVLLNLVRNAIDAMQSVACRHGRVVIVRTRTTPEGSVRISVIDSGTGVAREFESLLFTPFATTKETGMGMGLSICRSIIEDHEGRLGFENNAEHGATFYFDLPQEVAGED